MHPKARAQRRRFTTVLVHPSSNRREVVGPSVKAFAKRHGLCANEVYMILNGKSICYRGWMLEATYLLTHPQITLGHF